MKNPKLFDWKVLVFVAFVAVGLTAGVFTMINDRKPKGPNGERIGERSMVETFGDGNFVYDCSKPIEVEYVGGALGPGDMYKPVSQSEFAKYCRSGAAIEYRAVIDILKRPDISTTIAKYNTAEAWVRALGHDYISDKEYLKRILPAFADVKIDCIIVVHSPEGTRFFVESGYEHASHDDHRYTEVASADFLASLNKATDADVSNFWLALH